jgi:hypothetical protein
MDLFGDSITSPICASSSISKSLLNAAYGFPEFWKAWPSGPRKVGKQQCIDKWARLACAESASLIWAHVEWMKAQDDWLRGFSPMPMTYLNRQSWIDWEPPVIRKKHDVLAELKAHKGAAMPDHIRAQIKRIKGLS